MKGFWMVWNEQGSAPSYKHDTEESAKDEAERLARANPRHRFVVLRAIGAVIKTELTWWRFDSAADDDLPF